LKRLFLFLWVILFQVFLLDGIDLAGSINPYYYIIFILTIPKKYNSALSLLLSFLLGFSIDLFYPTTLGIHAFCCVLICYLKFFLINKFIPKDSDEVFNIIKLPIQKFIIFSTILILIHHFTFFFLTEFAINKLIYIVLYTIPTYLFTLILLIIHKIIAQSYNGKI